MILICFLQIATDHRKVYVFGFHTESLQKKSVIPCVRYRNFPDGKSYHSHIDYFFRLSSESLQKKSVIPCVRYRNFPNGKS